MPGRSALNKTTPRQPQLAAETTGAKLRRLARLAQNNNAWSRPYMRSVGPWQPSTAVTVSTMVVNGGNLYVCQTAGTTATTGGPTATNGQAITDGTAKWYFFAANQVTQDPVTASPAWTASTAVALGARVVNSGGVYGCVIAGTTASSGGPTTTGNAITDGTATWTYMGPTYTNPYASDFPTYTYGTAAPSGQTNVFSHTGGSNGGAGKYTLVPVFSIQAGGTGYVAGEVVTLAGGTFTTAGQFTVTAVSGGIVTGLALTNPGVYVSLPTTVGMSQGSTTGSGTGLVINVHFSQPLWCRVRGGDPQKSSSGNWCVTGSIQSAPAAVDPFRTVGLEFMTDAPQVTFRLLTSNGANVLVIVDGVRYNLAPLDAAAGASNNNYYSLQFPSGRKVRRWRLEADISAGFSLPPIYVDPNSTVWAPNDLDRIRAIIIGDSLTVGAAPGPFVTGNCVTLGLAHELGWNDPWNVAVGTTGYVHQNPGGANNNFGYRLTEAVMAKPDVWVFMGSWNDIGESTTAVTAAVTACIAAIRASGSKAPIIFFGIWSANIASASIGATEAAVQAGIVDPISNSYWIPIFNDPFLPWVTGSWNNNPAPNGMQFTNSTSASLYIDTPNSPHPADVGTVYEWRRMADAIRQNVLPLLP